MASRRISSSAALYLIGVILSTIAYHVPRNEALAKAEPESAAERLWRRYFSEWTAWSHLRTAASFAAASMFTIALHVG